MISVNGALRDAISRARRNGGEAGSIYLTQAHTDQLLEEMGTKRDGRMTRRPPVDRFDDLPVYPDKPISMLICYDCAGAAYVAML